MIFLLTRLSYLIIGLLGISFVLLFHEAGHFFVARLLKVDVEVFSIGIGPELFSFHGRKTILKFSLIPFGGYCSMKGSVDLMKALKDESKSFKNMEMGSFFTSSPISRFLIFLAGPTVNYLLAIILFGLTAIIPVESIIHEAKIVPTYNYEKLYPDSVKQEKLALEDKILSCDGKEINTWEEFENLIHTKNGSSLELIIQRDGKNEAITIESQDGRYGIALYEETVLGRVLENSPFKINDKIVKVNGSNVYSSLDIYENAHDLTKFTVLRDNEIIEISYDISKGYPFAWKTMLTKKSTSFGHGVLKGIESSKIAFINTIQSLIKVISGKSDDARDEVTGPTRAATSIGSITMLGFKTSIASGIRAYIYLLGFVSISLSVANLLPIPSFDGGQMLLNLFQIILRKEIKPRSYVIFHILGLICTAIILIFMYSLDLKHLIPN